MAQPWAGSGVAGSATYAKASAQLVADVPEASSTVTSTVPAACGGTVAVMAVSSTTAKPAAATPPKLTPVAPPSPEPLIVIEVAPVAGAHRWERPDTTGVAAAAAPGTPRTRPSTTARAMARRARTRRGAVQVGRNAGMGRFGGWGAGLSARRSRMQRAPSQADTANLLHPAENG